MRRTIVATLVCAVALGAGTANADLSEALNNFKGKVPQEVRELKRLNLVSAGQAAQRSGGPDGGGYVWDDSNDAGGPTYSWVEITATGTSVALTDDSASAAVPLGFTFNLYGTDFTSLYIGSNGLMTFGVSSTDFSNDCATFPDSVGPTPSNLVALMWDDMNPTTNADLVWYQAYAAGSCPWGGYAGACFVVQYDDFTHYSGTNGDAGTWEAIFFDNDEIVYQYESVGVEAGSGATIGIANGDQTIGLAYACDSATLTNGLAIHWYRSTAFPDLELTMTANTTDQGLGGNITVTLTVADIGTVAATGVVVTDTLPALVSYVSNTCGGTGTSPWTWNIGNLAAGASVSCNLVFQVDTCGVFTNTATVTGVGSEPTGNNTDSMTFNQAYDSISDGSFESGTPNSFWTEVSTNFGTPLCDAGGCGTGGGTAGPMTGEWWVWFGGATADENGSVTQNVVLTGAPALGFYLWAPVPGTATARGTFDVYLDGVSIFQIAQGDAAYAAYTQVLLDLSAYADGGSHSLRFEGIQIGPDVVTFNLDDVTLLACPTATADVSDLAITKVGASTVMWEGSYGINVTNNGPDAALNTVVTDTLPAGVTYLSDSCGGGAVGQLWTWNVGTLAVGATANCIIQVDISDYALTTNVATVVADGSDPVGSNNNATAIIAAPRPAIPALGRLGVAALAVLLAGAAWIVLRRRG